MLLAAKEATYGGVESQRTYECAQKNDEDHGRICFEISVLSYSDEYSDSRWAKLFTGLAPSSDTSLRQLVGLRDRERGREEEERLRGIGD
ncbi:hypothetical protein TorRG33x02_113210 [Trema orientale]|uniref:Uncharacterized protein n=1 Tax=Trema orientale TaxID=63057 RepID=A0A2P5F5G9_TREOI|nr:hypothetical protein TorRG33x02_113210 [Trema orientale]